MKKIEVIKTEEEIRVVEIDDTKGRDIDREVSERLDQLNNTSGELFRMLLDYQKRGFIIEFIEEE